MNKKYMIVFILLCLFLCSGIRTEVQAQTQVFISERGAGPNGGTLYGVGIGTGIPIRWSVSGGTFHDGLTALTIWGSEEIEVFWDPEACGKGISVIAYLNSYDHIPLYYGSLVLSTCPPPPPPPPSYAYTTCEQAQRALSSVPYNIPYRYMIIQSIMQRIRENPALNNCAFNY